MSAASSFAALKAQRDARRNPFAAAIPPDIDGSSEQAQDSFPQGSADAFSSAPPPSRPQAGAIPISSGRPSAASPISMGPPSSSANAYREPPPEPQHVPRPQKPEPGAAGSRVRLPDIQDLELRFDAYSSERALFYAPLPKNGPKPQDFSISSSAAAFSPSTASRSLSGSYSYSYSQLLSSSYSAPGGWAAAGISACRPGDVLLRVRPEVAVLSTSLLEQRCSACYSPPLLDADDQQSGTSAASKLQRCSGCKVIRYCSSACQRRDWPTHRDECKALKAIQQLHVYRQALRQQRQLDQRIANRYARPQGGSLPFGIGSFQDNDEVMAHANAAGHQRNSDGESSGEDEDDDNASRKSSSSRKDSVRLPSSMMRALARWIWARSRIGTGGKEKSRGEGADLLELISHRERFAPEQLQQQAQLALHLAQYLTAAARASATFGPVSRGEGQLNEMLQPENNFSQGDALRSLGIESATELLDLVCQFSSNSFTLTDSDLNPLGVCMHPSMAMLNHSCTPNAAVVFPFGGAAKGGQQKWNDGEDAKVMQLVALRAIEPGEELLISYVDIADTYEDRRSYLKKRYCFDCRCELCRKSHAKMSSANGNGFASPSSSPMQHPPFQGFGVRPTPSNNWIDPRRAVWCPQRCGGWIDGSAFTSTGNGAAATSVPGQAPEPKCNKCHSISPLTPADVSSDTDQAKELLKHVSRLFDRGDAETAWSQCSRALSVLVERYPPSWQPLFQLLRLATTCLIEVGSVLLSLAHDDPTHEDAAIYCFDEAVRMQMLVVAATQASNTPIYSKGHPARGIAIATLAKLVLAQFDHRHRQQQSGAALPAGNYANAPVCRAAVEQTAARGSSTLSILKDPPSVPDEMRVELARQLLSQSVEELDVGFGRSNQGGTTGREIRAALTGVEQELAIVAQTNAMSVS